MPSNINMDLKSAIDWAKGASAFLFENGPSEKMVDAVETLISVAREAIDLRRTVRELECKLQESNRYFLAEADMADALEKELTARRASIERAQGWQPIETAPKDGTPFLAMFTTNKQGKFPNKLPFVCRYSPASHEYSEGWELLNAYGEDEDNDFVKPSHWMPLPDPPKEGA